ncbi:hypothetical protein PV10_01352 [Exophiala mesophila]|uniref:Uncharacterized protein n=1 Tax=Exophiala mesophila TaxID=212818 RepID=A0A0D1ZUL0_EXOME|nr:uncharacterized protein PV10_01352 [Exophiala mesophila]KIV97629.1 hypothetical protein PV10_01352 [Exophiala mesophila]
MSDFEALVIVWRKEETHKSGQGGWRVGTDDIANRFVTTLNSKRRRACGQTLRTLEEVSSLFLSTPLLPINGLQIDSHAFRSGHQTESRTRLVWLKWSMNIHTFRVCEPTEYVRRGWLHEVRKL